MGEDRSTDARRNVRKGNGEAKDIYEQALHDAESTEAKVLAENGKVAIEESGRPTEFGEQEDDSLADD
jgi:hypothetical protein